MNKSTQRLKSLLNLPLSPTESEQPDANEVQTEDPNKALLRRISERLSGLPDTKYDDIREIFYEVQDIVTNIRDSQTFFQNQTNIKTCLNIAVECCNKLLNQSPIAPKSIPCIESTKNLFAYYTKYCKPDRATMKLHGNFLDKCRGVKDDLGSLIAEDVKDDVIEEHKPQSILKDRTFRQAADKVTLDSYEVLNTKWETLSTSKHNSKSKTEELADLSYQISKKAHKERKVKSGEEKSELLTLGLAVEARYIEQMQQSNKSLHSVTGSLKRAAQYFYSLSQHHRSNNEYDIANEMQRQYVLTAERADNISGILACRNVIHSDVTTASEKTRAVVREREFHAEKSSSVSELCDQYQVLRGGDKTAENTQDNTNGELPMSEKRAILDAVGLKDTNHLFEFYRRAKKYLNDIQFELLEAIQYDQLILSYDPLDQNQEQEMPLEAQARLFELLQTEAGQRLQSAIQFYYDVKCKYYDSIQQSHNRDESIETLRFRAAFQKEAYRLLFRRYTDAKELENPELFARNCHDILDAKNYSTPLLNIMVRQQLDSLSAYMSDDESFDNSEFEAFDLQEARPSTKRSISNPKKAKKASKVTFSIEEDMTLLEQVCVAQQARTVDFYAIIDKLEQDGEFYEATADKLYMAITDPDKHLIIDEEDSDAYYFLYEKLANYFEEKEKEALSEFIKKHLREDGLNKPIADEKLLLKSITIVKHMLNHKHLLSSEQMANLLFKLGDMYVYLQSLSPKPNFKTEGKQAFNELQKIIDELPENIKKTWRKFDLNTAIGKLNSSSSALNRVFATHHISEKDVKKHSVIADRINEQAQDYESDYRETIKNAHLYTFFDEIYQMIRLSLPEEKNLHRDTLPFKIRLRELSVNFSRPFNLYVDKLDYRAVEILKQYRIDPNNNTVSEWRRFYRYLLTIHAKVSDVAETGLCIEETGLLKERNPTYEAYKTELEQRLNSMRIAISRLSGLEPSPKHDYDRCPIVPVEIPQAFKELKDKSSVAERMLTCIKNKHYVRAIALSRATDCKQALVLKACLIKWVLGVISTDTFKAYLGKEPQSQKSYQATQSILEKYRQSLLIASKRQKSLLKICKKEQSSNLSRETIETPLQALSLFATDGMASTYKETPDEKVGCSNEIARRDPKHSG